MIKLWGISTAIIALIFASLCLWGNCDNKKNLVISFFMTEVIWSVAISRRLAKWQLAHFIWLAVSGLDGAFVPNIGQAKQREEDDKEKNRQLSETITTLEKNKKSNERTIDKLQREREKLGKEIQDTWELATENDKKYNDLLADVQKSQAKKSDTKDETDIKICKNVFGLKSSEQILVIGTCKAKTAELIKVAGLYGLTPKNLVFWNDYKKINHLTKTYMRIPVIRRLYLDQCHI